MTLRGLLAIGLVILSTLVSADDIEVIELRHRPAQEILPVVRPMLDDGGSMSAQGFQLIVRSSAANLRQIRQLVKTLDVAAQQLLISVYQGTQRELRALRIDAGLRQQQGNTSVVIGEPPSGGRSGVRAEILASDARLDDAPIHRLRVSAGSTGYIETGASVPLFSGRVWSGPRRDIVESGVDYRDVTTGFYVSPRLQGERVTLEISPHKNRLREGGAVVESQSANTMVSGPLGEWLEVGGTTERMRRSGQGTSGVYRTHERHNASIWIKAERVP